jgi:hypothetical protein
MRGTYYERVSASLSYPACKGYVAHYIAICGLSGSTIFFYTNSYTARFSGKKFIEHKMCVLIFSTTLSETSLILPRIQRDIIINVQRYTCRVHVILVRF